LDKHRFERIVAVRNENGYAAPDGANFFQERFSTDMSALRASLQSPQPLQRFNTSTFQVRSGITALLK
jgi:hypothetical protein